MKTFMTICVLLCLVPAYHAVPQLPCVRSAKCLMKDYQGCYIVKGMCRCERESCCGNPFPYSTLYECFAENIAQFEDPCKDAPCKHNGYCVQLSRSAKPNFRCDCHRTGYFGPRCHERCPKDVRKEISKFSESKAKFARERRRHLLACRL